MAKDYIAIVGKESLDAYLVVDQQVIDEVPIHNLPYLLIAAFLCTTFVTPKVVVNFIHF